MPLDLAAFDLHDRQRLRIALLQEVLDHSSNPKEALAVAIEAEGWIAGAVEEAVDLFKPDLLKEQVRISVGEAMTPEWLVEVVRPLVVELIGEESPQQSAELAPIKIAIDVPPKPEPVADSPKIVSIAPAAEIGIKPRASGPAKGTLCRPEPAEAGKSDPSGLTGQHLKSLRALREHCSGIIFTSANLRAIVDGIGENGHTILSELFRRGHIERVAMGRYRLPGMKGFDAKSDDARSAVEQFIAERGITSAPDFGFPEINKLYPALKARGHGLNMTTNKKYFLADGTKQMTYAECLRWAQDIVKAERPLADLNKPIADTKGGI